MLNNRLQMRASSATRKVVTLTKQTKIGQDEQVRVNWKPSILPELAPGSSKTAVVLVPICRDIKTHIRPRFKQSRPHVLMLQGSGERGITSVATKAAATRSRSEWGKAASSCCRPLSKTLSTQILCRAPQFPLTSVALHAGGADGEQWPQRWHNSDTDMQGPMKLFPAEPETLFLPRPRLDQNPKDHQM